MYTVSRVEKELLDAMIEMSNNYIVEASLKEIVQASGRKVTGGIHTHALQNLESMGIIRKISKCKWVILKYDITLNEKGSRVIFRGTNKGYMHDLQKKLHNLLELNSTELIKNEINNILETLKVRNNVIG